MTTENHNDEMECIDADKMRNWALDPSKNFSDRKLEIALDDDPGRIDTYHVHRYVLAVGERKSGYFERLLNNTIFTEHEIRTTRINLP
jgi:hypothetical protein